MESLAADLRTMVRTPFHDAHVRALKKAGETRAIPAGTIEKTKPMMSLMPANLPDQLKSRQEFLDLVRFVSLLGRPGPYANDESPVIRKWKVIEPKRPSAIPTQDAEWTTMYAMVSGELPAHELNIAAKVYAQGAINVQVAGQIKLLGDMKGLRLWVDGKEVSDPAASLDLAKGRHTLTFEIDCAKRGDKGLRVELAAPSGSSAKFQPEGGV